MAAHPKLTCLCGTISLPLPRALPAETELCHCNPCLEITGGLMAGFVELPNPPDASALANLTTYPSSATHSRLFCSVCGGKTLINVHHHPDGRQRDDWFAYSGSVERADGEEQSDVILPQFNMFVEDTVDGGLAPYMAELGGRAIPSYRVRDDELPLSQAVLDAMAEPSLLRDLPRPDERLRAACRCNAIELLIAPADHTDKAFSELERFVPLHPYNNITNKPITNKYQARSCVCRSCRLAMGVSLTSYAYIPPPKVLNARTGKPLAYAHAVETPAGKEANRGLETLTHYWSSSDACRSFCGGCGSTVFYFNEKRPDIVNVAAGILRAEEGALARRWLHWQPGEVSWKGEADQVVDRSILEAYVKADVN